MDPDRQWWLRVPAVFLSPRSVFVALRNDRARTWTPARSRSSRSSCSPGSPPLSASTHRAHALRRPGVRRAARRGLGVHRRRAHRVRRLLHRRRRALPRGAGSAASAPSGAPGTSSASRWRRSRSRCCSSGRSSSRSSAATSSARRLRRRRGGRVFDAARARLRALVGRAAPGRRPRRARLELVALARRARTGRPLPSGVRVASARPLGLPRRARAPPAASRRCAAPPGSGARARRPRRRRPPS